MPKARTTLLIPLCAMLALTACAGGPPIVTANAAGCAQLLPEAWKKGVEAAPLPEGNTVGDWISFADATVGKLDVANDRTVSAIGIVERCEARDAAAVKRATRKWYQVF